MEVTKRAIRNLSLLISIAIIFTGCETFYYSDSNSTGPRYEKYSAYGFTYPSDLIEVERSSEAISNWGVGIIHKGDSTSTYSGKFVDSLLSISFNVTDHLIRFTINNKSNNTLKVNWDNSSYVSYYNRSMKIIHEGVRLIDRELPQSSSIIIKNSMLTDIAVPSKYILFAGGEWNYMGLIFGPSFGEEMPQSIIEANNVIGRGYSLMLQIEFDGKAYDYLFKFITVGKPTYNIVRRM